MYENSASTQVTGKLKKSIEEFLKEFVIPSICEVDTRALTKKIRSHGTMKSILQTYTENIDIAEFRLST